MSERILTVLSGVLAGLALPAMAVLFVAVGDLSKRIDTAIEAVAVIEDAAQRIQTSIDSAAERIDASGDATVAAVSSIEASAQSIEEDMNILRNIADREECYDNRGEWSDEYGCHLEEAQ